jgi:hypothetical protein
MIFFDQIINDLSRNEVYETGIPCDIQLELSTELTALVATLFYHSDEDLGKAVKMLLTDSINNHMYYLEG